MGDDVVMGAEVEGTVDVGAVVETESVTGVTMANGL